ncbi:histone-lysine N-methyltransferase EHMT1a isoform X2 [Denticeps clupeoides]|uniref:histone-lysine N-methyltransferase EHMT1a isoform X2 n=1 Tax=Denticeps clupeoides TaxID=299321 RepID=UPI0010A5766C|nr:histone-lysine N-methyltransferase EHMT1-like isoform X2 [Denticeps clupeoides]
MKAVTKPKADAAQKHGDTPKRGRKPKRKSLQPQPVPPLTAQGDHNLQKPDISPSQEAASNGITQPRTPGEASLSKAPGPGSIQQKVGFATKTFQATPTDADGLVGSVASEGSVGTPEGGCIVGSPPAKSRYAWKSMVKSPSPSTPDILNEDQSNTAMRVEEKPLQVELPQNQMKQPAGSRKRKRKMGLYSFVPKKKTKVVKKQSHHELSSKAQPTLNMNGTAEREGDYNRQDSGRDSSQIWKEDNGPGNETTKSKASNTESHVEEYTTLPLHSLDLRSQEDILSSLHSGLPEGADGLEADVMLELPLCCCRMEAPKSQEILTLSEGKCMAVESVDGKLNLCRKDIMKLEMMRPSNRIPLLVLCEEHRAGMVKHQCCPRCGFFCKAGTFMECQPDGNISHRFHRSCASIIRGQIFCPHCGEDAGQAQEVTVTKPDPVLVGSPGPACQKKNDISLTGSKMGQYASSPNKSKMVHVTAGVEKETLPAKQSLESVLDALDDERYKTSKFPPDQLYCLSKEGELQKVMQMLVEGVDPNLKMDGAKRQTSLHAAAEHGHKEICHILVQAGANLDMCDEDQRTPLMYACENNHLETVRYLMKAGGATNHKDIRGSTCLHLAAKMGHIDVMQLLLSVASIDVNGQDDGGWTPITWAIEFNHKDQVNLLLSRGANVHVRDKEENICLHWAAFSGSDDIAQVLLETRSDLHAVNVYGDSPLHIAVRENKLDCVMLFLSRGADVNLRNREGDTPLDCCIHSSKLWTILNTNKKLTDARKGRENQGEMVLSRDISRGYEPVPVPCINGVDLEPCPSNFKYVPDYCFTSQMNIDENITHLQHCKCKDDCSSSSCVCGQLSVQCWYDKEGRLMREFSREDPPFLFECNHACLCWRSCRNRVVQNGLRTRLQIFRTERMGWGVRALQDIPEGTFVCEFVGEIISDGEANTRQNDAFLFNLDNKVGDVYCIDAQFYGNLARFMNHLCEPNLFPVRVYTKHQDLRFPRIALFSSKPIKVGEELGFDYGDHFWKIKSKYLTCQCRSPKCRYPALTAQQSQMDIGVTKASTLPSATASRKRGDGPSRVAIKS